MKKRCLSFLLAAILLLSLLPMASAEEEPAQPEIDIAALTEHINRGGGTTLTSEVESASELESVPSAAKRTKENGFNEVFPRITDDGRGIVLGDVAVFHYLTFRYDGVGDQLFFIEIYYGTEITESNFVGNYYDHYGTTGYNSFRELSWDTASDNMGLGEYTILFFTAYEQAGKLVIAEPTLSYITVELCKNPIALERVYFADLNGNEIKNITTPVYHTNYCYVACEPKNATCDRYLLNGFMEMDERMFCMENAFGILEITPFFSGPHYFRMIFEDFGNKVASLDITAYERTGKCGPNVSWSTDSKNGTLNIYGTGDMYNYEVDALPWAELKNSIDRLNVGDGVTRIGRNAFNGCSGLNKVSIADSVKSIDDAAFSGCDRLTQIILPASVTSVGDNAFSGQGLTEVYCLGDAPTTNCAPFGTVDDGRMVTVYYNEGAAGWTTPTWNGYPTKPCDPGYPPLFNDVSHSDWYFDSVRYATEHKLMRGTGTTTFEPEGSMTRAMLVTVLWRYAGSPEEGTNTFVDVPEGLWYTQAVAWAAENGIVGGVGKGRFDPDGKITREQIATILYRYAQNNGLDVSGHTGLGMFLDDKDVSDWALKAMNWAVSARLILGSDDMLLPQGDATRAQVAAIFMRFIENIVKK